MFRQKIKLALVMGVVCLCMPLWGLSYTNYTITKGDTLWSIAKTHKPSGISTSNMIQAIEGLNVSSSPGIVDNVLRLGDKIVLPSNTAEALKAIDQLNKAQNSYQRVINNKAQADKATPTTNSHVSDAPSHKPQPKTNLTSKNQAIVSSINQQQMTVTQQTNQGYQVSVNQASTPKVNDQGKSHLLSTVIWLFVIVVLIFIIFRRIKKKKRSKNNENMQQKSYVRQAPLTGGISNQSEQYKEIDSSNVSEVLVEAMLLLNDGRYEDARHTLQQSLKIQPNNIDIRMKLMEVYAASGDEVSFNSERDYLSAHLMSHNDERWQEIDEIYHQYFILKN